MDRCHDYGKKGEVRTVRTVKLCLNRKIKENFLWLDSGYQARKFSAIEIKGKLSTKTLCY